MKYLIQNRKEFSITIAALIVAILDCLKVLGVDVPNFSEEYLLTIISAIMGVLVWFYNMPTSLENCKHTGAMRLEKKQNKGIFDGENFIDEGEEVEIEDAIQEEE